MLICDICFATGAARFCVKVGSMELWRDACQKCQQYVKEVVEGALSPNVYAHAKEVCSSLTPDQAAQVMAYVATVTKDCHPAAGATP
jgi:hypothetical protein